MATKNVSRGAKSPGVLLIILSLIGVIIICYGLLIMPGQYHSGFPFLSKINNMWNNNTWMWFLYGGAALMLLIGGGD